MVHEQPENTPAAVDIMLPSSSTSIEQVLSLLELEHDDETMPDRCCASSAGSSVGGDETCCFDNSSNSLLLSPKEHCKQVSFSTVQVREYAVTVGDHPCCQSGVPLALDWTVVVSRPQVSLDVFEQEHGQRRSRGELLLTWEERKELYLDDTPEVRRQTRTRQRQRCRDQAPSRDFFATPIPHSFGRN